MKQFWLFSFGVLFYLLSSAAPQIEFIAGKDLISGSQVQLATKDKKGIVVVFLSAKCPCSNSHNIELKDLAQTYKEFGFVAIHSNLDEGKELSRLYFEDAAFPFPVIADEGAKIADQLKALKTPHAYIFANSGALLYQGGVSNSKDCAKADRKFLREALNDIQHGIAVRTPEGRTLGCVISRGGKSAW